MKPADPVGEDWPIFGIPVRATTSEAAIEALGALPAGPRQIAFLNAHNANLAWDDARVADAFRAGLVLNDGIGLDIAARLLHGAPFPENLNGTDLVPLFLQRTQKVLRVYVLGGAEGVAERARDAFAAVAPQHVYVGARHGYFSNDESPTIAAAIAATKADVLLLGLGSPRQELWMQAHLAATGCRLGFCVGGLIDFASGHKPRAPELIRRLHCEWIFRLMLEPRRLARRYLLGNLVFLARVARERLRPPARRRAAAYGINSQS
jgi:alpha-1,3-mannosyltransferase